MLFDNILVAIEFEGSNRVHRLIGDQDKEPVISFGFLLTASSLT